MGKLSGKVAIITGGARGWCARRAQRIECALCAKLGGDIGANDRHEHHKDQDSVANLADRLRSGKHVCNTGGAFTRLTAR